MADDDAGETPTAAASSAGASLTSPITAPSLDFERGLKFMTAEEAEMEDDFCNSLTKFGVPAQYIQKFREDAIKGWEIRPVDKETLERQHHEASLFMKCIELEEILQSVNDPLEREQVEQEIEGMKVRLEILKQDRMHRVAEPEEHDFEVYHDLLNDSTVNNSNEQGDSPERTSPTPSETARESAAPISTVPAPVTQISTQVQLSQAEKAARLFGRPVYTAPSSASASQATRAAAPKSPVNIFPSKQKKETTQLEKKDSSNDTTDDGAKTEGTRSEAAFKFEEF